MDRNGENTEPGYIEPVTRLAASSTSSTSSLIIVVIVIITVPISPVSSPVHSGLPHLPHFLPSLYLVYPNHYLTPSSHLQIQTSSFDFNPTIITGGNNTNSTLHTLIAVTGQTTHTPSTDSPITIPAPCPMTMRFHKRGTPSVPFDSFTWEHVRSIPYLPIARPQFLSIRSSLCVSPHIPSDKLACHWNVGTGTSGWEAPRYKVNFSLDFSPGACEVGG